MKVLDHSPLPVNWEKILVIPPVGDVIPPGFMNLKDIARQTPLCTATAYKRIHQGVSDGTITCQQFRVVGVAGRVCLKKFYRPSDYGKEKQTKLDPRTRRHR